MTHNVDPELLPALEALKGLWGDTSMDLSDINVARQIHDAMAGHTNSAAPKTDGVESSRQVITNEEHGFDVIAYVHQPTKRSTSPLSVLLHIHGGGLVTGSAAHAESQLRAWVKQYNCVVVSVEYRLAPEHPFPSGLLDCFTVLQWLHNQPTKLNVNSEKIVVFGESAGGCLAAGLALYARDHSEIKIARQILLYPMLDFRNVEAADQANLETLIWSRKNNQFGWASYMSSKVDDAMLAYASPTFAENWRGLPPTYVCVGDIDLFHKESVNYVEKLCEAEVSAEIDVYPAAYHAFQVVVPEAGVSKKCLQKLNEVLTQSLA